MLEKLRPSDYRFVAICILLLGGTAWFSARNFYRAFPEASIDFRVNREGGLALAEKALAQQGYGLSGYRQASTFTFDNQAKTFLERTAGLEKANQLMGRQIRIWRWSYRWFRPQQKEGFRADITPAGEWVGFEHEVPEDAYRPDASAGQARTLAEAFLRDRMHRDPAAMDFLESTEIARPHRTDRTFTWKERGFELRDASYRINVTTLGNEVGAAGEYLKIPEQWSRDYRRLRSRNQIAQTVDTVVTLALVIGLIAVIVARVHRQDVRWRRAAWIGIAGMALSLCSHLNSLPLQLYEYPTTDSFGSFLFQQLLQAVSSALGAGGILFLLTAGAEPLYREAYGGQISLGNLFRFRGLRTRRFFRGAVLGITLTGVFIGYQVAFYILASRLGAWSPVDVPYDDMLNTTFPWLFVLFGGYFPAVSEEFLFRMFAIPFLRRLVRWTPLALLLAGFIWGFGHSGYAQQPFFIRGLEVGIGGFALGIIMLRWGILPALVWHYSVDAMYTAMLLLRSHNSYFQLSGAASAGILVLPIAAALIAYWRSGGFEPETGLLNRDEPKPLAPAPVVAAEAAAPTWDYSPLSLRRRVVAVLLFAAGMMTLWIPVPRFGETPRFQLSAEQVRNFADAFLRQHSVDPAKFRHVISPAVHWAGDDSLAGKYFLEHLPVPAASAVFENNRSLNYWDVRYYQPLHQEEVLVTVHPESGKILGFSHNLPEDQAGAALSEDAAREIAVRFAAANGLALGSMELKENAAEQRKARLDRTLVWEARAGDARNVAEARYRMPMELAGDAVTGWRVYWKIPEAFARDRSRQNWISMLVFVLNLGVLSLGAVFGILLLVRNIGKSLIPWRTAMYPTLAATLLLGVSRLLTMDQSLQNYPTAVPLDTFLATTYLGILMLLLGSLLVFGGAAAVLTSYFPESVAALRTGGRRRLGLDAGVALLTAAGLALAVSRFAGILQAYFHRQAILQFAAPQVIVSRAPALQVLSTPFPALLVFAAALAVFVLVMKYVSKPWAWIAGVFLALCIPLPGEIRTLGELALAYSSLLLYGLAAAIFCICFARRNPLSYLLVFCGAALVPRLSPLFESPNPALHAQGYVVLAVMAAGLVWMIAPSVWQPTREKRATV